LLERLSRKDAEIRKLIIQLEEWKEWKIKYEELYKKYTIDIQTLRQEYEKKLSVLQAEYDRLKKEHSVCP
jgi:Skp family chaperone for outer membrane proteins